MWRRETETLLKEYEPGKLFPLEVVSLVNDEGVRVTPCGRTREKARRFYYSGHGVYLKMRVTRYDADGDQVLDKYIVTPSPPQAIRQLFQSGKPTPEDTAKIDLIKLDIISALSVWQPESERLIPIRKVVFSPFFDIRSSSE